VKRRFFIFGKEIPMKKKLQALGLALALIGQASLVWSQEVSKTVTLEIKGMTCAMCGAKVENSLKRVEGVTKALVDNKTGKGTVEYNDGKVSQEQILEACNKTGFKCSL
jgi:copper chaperone CopZ